MFKGEGLPARTEVVGVPVSMTSYDQMMQILHRAPPDRAGVVTVCNVHSVMSARRDPALFEAISGSDVSTPDGMPLVWTLRVTADKSQQRVYGPDLMRRALAHGVAAGWSHYLFGASPGVLEQLEYTVRRIDPGVKVAGSFSPPFRPMEEEEEEAALQAIRDSGASIVWVGLGMPNQELWMWRVRRRLPGVWLVGVGAAFDFLAGAKTQAPGWMQRIGLEWLFRLLSEPRRLWRRYAWNNPAFFVLMWLQMAKHQVSRRSR